MAQNEAKIKFTAECEQFNAEIKSADQELKVLRAELKKNASEAKLNGESQENLSSKIGILEQEMTAAKSKTEAMTQKLEKAKRIFGEDSTEVANLKVKLSQCETVENSIQADINKANQALKDQEGDAGQAASALDHLGDEAKDTGREVASIGDIAIGNMIADWASSAIESLVGLEQETRQFRTDMSKLDTAFETNGFSAEQAQKSYEGLYRVIGEDDRSVETANHLAKLCATQAQLDKWTTICTGVYATFGDSLPIEGLTEAANETAKVAKVTGPLADAINWSTTSTKEWNAALSGNKTAQKAFNDAMKGGATAEDAFNAALESCSSEQERSALITDTLNSLYSESADSFEKMNGKAMEANAADAELKDSQAQLADAIAPVTTAVTKLAAKGLGLLARNAGTAAPILAIVAVAAGAMAIAMNGASIATKAMAIAQGILNSALLANPIVLIIAAVAALAIALVAIYKKSETFRKAVNGLWKEVKKSLAPVFEALKPLVKAIGKLLSSLAQTVGKVLGPVIKALTPIIKTVFTFFANHIASRIKIATAAIKAITHPIKTAKTVFNGFKTAAANAFNGAVSKITAARDKIKSIMNKIKGFFPLKIGKIFSNIKLPHITVSGGKAPYGIAGKGRLPKFSVKWYRKAMNNPTILNGATIFGASGGKFLAGGESGSEMIGGTNTIMNMIGNAVQSNTPQIDEDKLAKKMAEACAKIGISIKLDKRELGRALREI